ncbi:uncharacterized protein LOC124888891 [Capsicum annuum]|uniref:uncharacterized protein LOC124888891 n=1 Tax=Capsicum annuum TaxID=4072 RepID=UPI001FB171CD|nr:uncharacterized protein LOC124888891 [Capsicum annuum]
MEFDDDPYERENDEQTSVKRKRPNDDELKPNEVIIETSKVKESQIISMTPIIIPPPFPQWLKIKRENANLKIFLDKFNNLSINIPLIEALQEMPRFAKFMKELVSKKHLVEGETIEVTHHYSVIISRTMAKKKKDPRAFTIPCTIRMFKFPKALCDLGESVNLIPYAIFHKLGLGKP